MHYRLTNYYISYTVFIYWLYSVLALCINHKTQPRRQLIDEEGADENREGAVASRAKTKKKRDVNELYFLIFLMKNNIYIYMPNIYHLHNNTFFIS